MSCIKYDYGCKYCIIPGYINILRHGFYAMCCFLNFMSTIYYFLFHYRKGALYSSIFTGTFKFPLQTVYTVISYGSNNGKKYTSITFPAVT